MLSADGKMRTTDVNTEQLFRLIQPIPSPEPEPFKLWFTKIAFERLDEMQMPRVVPHRFSYAEYYKYSPALFYVREIDNFRFVEHYKN